MGWKPDGSCGACLFPVLAPPVAGTGDSWVHLPPPATRHYRPMYLDTSAWQCLLCLPPKRPFFKKIDRDGRQEPHDLVGPRGISLLLTQWTVFLPSIRLLRISSHCPSSVLAFRSKSEHLCQRLSARHARGCCLIGASTKLHCPVLALRCWFGYLALGYLVYSPGCPAQMAFVLTAIQQNGAKPRAYLVPAYRNTNTNTNTSRPDRLENAIVTKRGFDIHQFRTERARPSAVVCQFSTSTWPSRIAAHG